MKKPWSIHILVGKKQLQNVSVQIPWMCFDDGWLQPKGNKVTYPNGQDNIH